MLRSTRTRSMAKAERQPSSRAADVLDLVDFLPHRLLITAERVSRVFSRRFNEELDLSVWEWRLLATLGRVGSASPTSVTEMTAINKVEVSRAVAGMKARKLLTQTAHKSDGRARVLRLTARGAATYRRALVLAHETEREITAGIPRADVATLHASLGRLLVHVGALPPLHCGPLDG
jgi:DNA-binding MarR family transcriptional regulator